MGYNGYDNRRGGYNGYNNRSYRNNGYNGYRGYNNPGYQPQQDPFQNPGFPFDIGQVVIHKATKEELTVIRFGREQIECRLPNLSSEWFYVHELEPKDNSSK